MRSEFQDVVDVPFRSMASLPRGAAEGSEVDLLVDKNGVYGGPYLWRMKRVAGVWIPVGTVAPLRAPETGTATGSLTSGVVGEFANTPNIDIPYAGVWEFSMALTYVSSAGATAQWLTGLRVGTTDEPTLAVNNAGEKILTLYPAASPPGGYSQAITQQRDGVRYTVAAGVNVRMRHYAVNVLPGIAGRLITARPVRLTA